MFKELSIGGWRQFGQVDLAFHPQLTILTGANASGKTTLLHILGLHFNWNVSFVGVPKRGRDGKIRYVSGLRPSLLATPSQIIGHITYVWGQRVDLQVPEEVGTQFQVNINNIQQFPGLSIPSHRSISGYQPVPDIPTQFNPSEQILNQYRSELLQRYLGVASGRAPMYWMKQTLLSAALFKEDTEALRANEEAREIFHGFEDTLRVLLPGSLGFRRIFVEPPEVMLETDTGTFPIDAVSGGITALMEVAWQIFLRSRGAAQFTVCIDEPENHLHPELQRAVIPSLLQAFPTIQFVIATHSPIIVTSTAESNVYVLRFEEGVVRSQLLDQANKAGTADETLREVLGLDATLPIWAEARLREIVDKYSKLPVTTQALDGLREELADIGLADSFPEATADIVERERLSE